MIDCDEASRQANPRRDVDVDVDESDMVYLTASIQRFQSAPNRLNQVARDTVEQATHEQRIHDFNSLRSD